MIGLLKKFKQPTAEKLEEMITEQLVKSVSGYYLTLEKNILKDYIEKYRRGEISKRALLDFYKLKKF
jgi:hypothetical protein